ncbi:hypothetical protein KR018_005333 [Drosophila ironensis]|nr:hypothetical protein KR018_005333 [Drosophila ironensis]
MSLMVVKVASTAALYQQQQLHQHQDSANAIASSEEDTPAEAATGGNDSDSDIEKMRAKLQQLQHEQQQQYLRQQQHYLQLHLQQMQQSAAAQGGGVAVAAGGVAGGPAGGGAAGETAYLLERADNSFAPIYGTWGTKARRPLHATSSLASDEAHVYERLPKRSATMTPLKGLLRDQMQRPPRLATQDMQLSLGSPSPPPPPTTSLLRRQYSETPGTRAQREDFKPKPFHFPYDGPLPEQFSKGEARPELNNIQDILQHLHISGLAPSKLPPMVMMPTGLHIAGTYKNLKSSGIGNFFRGKRNKKQMQFNIPLPLSPMGHHMPMTLPMMMPFPMQWYPPGVLPQQRVSIDQLFPYKPRSPQDVNLLAMQPLGNQKPISKKKKKKQQQQQQQQQLLEHGSQQQQQFVTDPFGPSVFALNSTRQPNHKRIPFKVNLDIYPVLPPSRPASVMHRHPEYAMPSAAALTGTTAAAFHNGHGIYQTPFRFPTQAPVVFPDQATRYSQQLYQQAQRYPPPPKSVLPEEATYGQGQALGPGQVESHTSPIMLHLNVFPKQKPTSNIRASTNPFYNHNMRNTLQSNDLPPPNPPSPIEPRNVVNGNSSQSQNAHQQPQQHQQHHSQHLNQTQQQQVQLSPGNRSTSISRSDHLPLIDFEHPIVAAELPDPASLTSSVRHNPEDNLRYRKTPVDEHYRQQKSVNIEQLAAEAQTASLFRFPVEDLIQFQVDDAL